MNTAGTLSVYVRSFLSVGRSSGRLPSCGCAARHAALSWGSMIGKGLAEAGRAWSRIRGATQSCHGRVPPAPPPGTKPALSQATAIFSQGPSGRGTAVCARTAEQPTLRITTEARADPKVLLNLSICHLQHEADGRLFGGQPNRRSRHSATI